MMKPPPSEEFSSWAADTLGIDPRSPAHRNWINTNVSAARSAVQNHPFFADFQKFLSENKAGPQYSPVNIINPEVNINAKSFDSVVSKLFRVNFLGNNKFPNAPNGGWVESNNIFARLNDLVRTVVTCRFFNEPRLISEMIEKIAAIHNLDVVIKSQARDVGYYAYHIYIFIPMSLVNQNWQEFDVKVQFEIQITTEIQYIIYHLTHKFYEVERHIQSSRQDDWKWDSGSPRFSASYISHSLHLLEGLIQRLYDDTKTEAAGLKPDVADIEEIVPKEGDLTELKS